MVDDIQEMLVVVLLPFSVIAAGITLTILITVFLIIGFWRLIGGNSE
jgi:hypothetical protein